MLHEIAHSLKTIWAELTASMAGLGVMGDESLNVSGLFDGAPRWVHVLAWIFGLLTAMGGFILMVRRFIKESDAKTKNVVDQSVEAVKTSVNKSVTAAHTDTVRGLARQLEIFREEEKSRAKTNESLSLQIGAIHNALRDFTTAQDQIFSLASQVGEHGLDIQKLKKDTDEFHNWRRSTQKVIDDLVAKWKREHGESKS